jgi:MOSC domain-containing protein YiiM
MTAIRKHAVSSSLRLTTTGLVGDAVVSASHGGPEKAVLCFATSHYPAFHADYKLTFAYGSFGENFLIDSADEASVCIGDVYDVAGARVQVSQPREPCTRQSRYWRIPDLHRHAAARGRTGWYLRVLAEEEVEAPTPFVLVDRRFAQWTVQRANEVFYALDASAEELLELASCPALSAKWRARLSARAEKLTPVHN